MKNLIVSKGSEILTIQIYLSHRIRNDMDTNPAHNLVLIDMIRKEYQKEREKSAKDALKFFGKFAGLLSDLSEDDKRIFDEIISDRGSFFREREF